MIAFQKHEIHESLIKILNNSHIGLMTNQNNTKRGVVNLGFNIKDML